MSEVDLFWDSNIKEFEVDPSWKEHEIYKSSQYKEYRTKWGEVSRGKYLGSFPLNIEMEPTYYCNLKCPMCPRTVSSGERKDNHMKTIYQFYQRTEHWIREVKNPL